MDEYFRKILDDIKSSTKEVKVLPSDDAVREKMREKYEIYSRAVRFSFLPVA